MKWGAAIAVTALLAACGGDDGTDGAPGAPGQDADPAILASIQADIDKLGEADAAPESCAVCHNGDIAANGADHQAAYDEYYQDGVIKVTTGSMTFAASGTSAVVSFEMTKGTVAFDCTDADSLGSYWAPYDAATKTFTDATTSLITTKAAAGGVCTLTATGLSTDQVTEMNGNGIVTVYGVDEILYENGVKHIKSGKYPFAGILKVGAVDYASAANVSGCENCHTQPFLKHTYIYGEVTDNAGNPTEFYTCKGCHYDTRGGHVESWQVLADDPARYAALGTTPLTAAEKTKYAYKAKLMNDVHMSHAMEFAYPQSMKNCVTCHAGKLATVLDSAKFFRGETCISCHSVDGITAKMEAAAYNHGSYVANLKTADCSVCHGNGAPTIGAIHNGGYDPKIYTSSGQRYSSAFVAKIDSAIFAGNMLTVKFSATESPDIAGLAVTDIVPTVLMGLYGYDTKDFLVSGHGRDADRNRLLEWTWGTTNPRFTQGAGAAGSWEVTVDLSMWADQIADGSIKRAEIAIMPQLKNAAGDTLGLNAPSRTFNLVTKAFVTSSDIVNVAGCNTCHDQLATTFHSGNRGGNVTVCRICHSVESAGSHLELQSRSIDSYVHAIHSFQAFDPGDIDFADPVEALEFQHHLNSEFPRFGILDCQSCHKAGTYNVPNQGKSLPSLQSGTDDVSNDRTIGTYPRYVTGPGARACGSCHRSQAINADGGMGDAGKLASLMGHLKTNGFMIEDGDGVWAAIVAKVMGFF